MQSLVKLLNRRTGAKTALVLLTITILIFAFASMTTSAPGITYGDVNDDGKIDVRDVVLVMQYIIGLRDLTEDQFKAADVNGDGEVNVQDVTMIMRHVLNIETLAKAIKSVEEVNINVFVNNPADMLYFPEKVKVTLADDSHKEIEVEWEETSSPPYIKEEVGEYVFEGELVNLPWGISNPEGLKASAVVNVLRFDGPTLPIPSPDFDGLVLVANPARGGNTEVFNEATGFYDITGFADIREGDTVTLRVRTNPEYRFVNWTYNNDEVSSSQTFDFTMFSDRIVLVANFELIDDPVDPEFTFEDVGGQILEIVTGVFNVWLPFSDAEDLFPGITQDNVIRLHVPGKDNIILEYNAVRDAFFQASVQGYTENEIKGAVVSSDLEVDDPVTATDLNVTIDPVLPGVYNVSIDYSDAQAGLTGVTTDSVLILDVAGKDPLELEYNSVRDAFFQPAVQGYSELEIESALVTVE